MEPISVLISIAGIVSLALKTPSLIKIFGGAIAALGLGHSLGLLVPSDGDGGPNPPIKFPPQPLNPSMPSIPWNPYNITTPEHLYYNPWQDASVVRPLDPLVLDLNRDGKIELQNATYFDLNANGFHEYTRWISETDAFLVLDKNASGLIDDGGEMYDCRTAPEL